MRKSSSRRRRRPAPARARPGTRGDAAQQPRVRHPLDDRRWPGALPRGEVPSDGGGHLLRHQQRGDQGAQFGDRAPAGAGGGEAQTARTTIRSATSSMRFGTGTSARSPPPVSRPDGATCGTRAARRSPDQHLNGGAHARYAARTARYGLRAGATAGPAPRGRGPSGVGAALCDRATGASGMCRSAVWSAEPSFCAHRHPAGRGRASSAPRTSRRQFSAAASA